MNWEASLTPSESFSSPSKGLIYRCPGTGCLLLFICESPGSSQRSGVHFIGFPGLTDGLLEQGKMPSAW